MVKKRTRNIFTIVKNLITAHVARLSDIATLASFEAMLAKRTLFTIIILSGVIVILLMSSWLCLLTWLFFYLLTFKLSLVMSAFILVIINALSLLGVVLYILKIKQRLFFPATRRQIAHLTRGIEEK